MSVLIKGMDIPKSCLECITSGLRTAIACAEWTEISAGEREIYRSLSCPLVELPEKHGRLIDADAAMKQWGLDKATKYGNETAEQQHFSYSTMMMYEIADILDDAPVVIEAEGE